MLCCAGLIGGLVVGQYLGGPWTFIAPAAGFGIGLAGDMKLMPKLMKGHHQRAEQHDTHHSDMHAGVEHDPHHTNIHSKKDTYHKENH